jgi:hypothetical protein
MSLPDHEAFAFSVSSIDEDLPFVETDFEGADNRVLAKPQSELLRLINLIPDIVITVLDE